MFAVLPVMRQLHEMLWYLAEAAALPAAAPLHAEVEAAARAHRAAGRRQRRGAGRRSTSALTAGRWGSCWRGSATLVRAAGAAATGAAPT